MSDMQNPVPADRGELLIRAEGLVKTYYGRCVVNHVSLNVHAGEVVGLAASVCHAHDALPRAVYQKYLPQLQELMRRGAAVEGPLPDNHRFNEQPSLPAPKALKSE